MEESRSVGNGDLQELIGLPLDEAVARARELGKTIRVAAGDEAPDALRADLRTGRVSVATERGKVTAIVWYPPRVAPTVIA